MIVDQVASNVELALFHARNLQQMRALNPQANIDAVLSRELTNGFASHFYPATDSTVAVYVGGDRGRMVAYFDGINSAAQGAQLVSGYSKFGGLQIIPGPNEWIRTNLDYYVDKVGPGRTGLTQYLDLCGYSAGGAVATDVAWKLMQTGNLQKKKVITFGAPAPGGPNVRDTVSMLPIARYMTRNDPIPLVPPRLQDAPQFAAIVPAGVIISWSNMVHTQGGVVINSDGTTEPAILPPDAAMTPGTALADWMFGLESTGGNPHALTNYITYLQASQTQYVTPRQKSRELAPAQQPEDSKKAHVNRQRDKVVNAVRDAQHLQNSVIVNQPVIVLFRPVRNGRLWTVEFGDKIVCQGVREDTCRHLCRAGNDFLRSLPKQGLVDPITLAAQFESFLAFATAPESDWLPKLKTNLDV